MTDNPKNFDSLQERKEQVLNNISQLQIQEKDLCGRQHLVFFFSIFEMMLYLSHTSLLPVAGQIPSVEVSGMVILSLARIRSVPDRSLGSRRAQG